MFYKTQEPLEAEGYSPVPISSGALPGGLFRTPYEANVVSHHVSRHAMIQFALNIIPNYQNKSRATLTRGNLSVTVCMTI